MPLFLLPSCYISLNQVILDIGGNFYCQCFTHPVPEKKSSFYHFCKTEDKMNACIKKFGICWPPWFLHFFTIVRQWQGKVRSLLKFQHFTGPGVPVLCLMLFTVIRATIDSVGALVEHTHFLSCDTGALLFVWGLTLRVYALVALLQGTLPQIVACVEWGPHSLFLLLCRNVFRLSWVFALFERGFWTLAGFAMFPCILPVILGKVEGLAICSILRASLGFIW